ncbi:MAG: hypothetical protein H0X25_15020, partial [Acidobacteriales bacterium]|nr:hypothetical protein [Terriglobales bacterium]
EFHSLSDEKQERISIGERNDHFYDADEVYAVDVKGVLSIALEADKLEGDDVSDDDIEKVVQDAVYNVEVDELSIPASDFM